MDDSTIAGTLTAANNAEIKLAQYANGRTKNDDVKTYAQRVITDDQGINKNLDDLLGRIDIKAKDTSDWAKMYTNDADTTLAKWKDMSDAEFDRAYIDHEVSFHQKFVDTFDRDLMPNVKNDEFKTMVMAVRPTYVAHLDQAKRLQSRLVGS
jgi:putative membrane protein